MLSCRKLWNDAKKEHFACWQAAALQWKVIWKSDMDERSGYYKIQLFSRDDIKKFYGTKKDS